MNTKQNKQLTDFSRQSIFHDWFNCNVLVDMLLIHGVNLHQLITRVLIICKQDHACE